jgi:hypothetical protein
VECMPVGFEITLPTLLEMAKGFGLDLPYDEAVLQEIYSKRYLKLSKYTSYHLLFSVLGFILYVFLEIVKCVWCGHNIIRRHNDVHG